MALLRGTASRSLALTVTTTNCINVRKQPYKAKLALVYDYLVEYNEVGIDDPDLIGVENAVVYGVAAALDTCDVDGSPLCAVELATRHHVFKDGKLTSPF